MFATAADRARTGAGNADTVGLGMTDLQALDIRIGLGALCRSCNDSAAVGNLQILDPTPLLVGSACGQRAGRENPLDISFADGQGWIDVRSDGHDMHIQRMHVVFESPPESPG